MSILCSLLQWLSVTVTTTQSLSPSAHRSTLGWPGHQQPIGELAGSPGAPGDVRLSPDLLMAPGSPGSPGSHYYWERGEGTLIWFRNVNILNHKSFRNLSFYPAKLAWENFLATVERNSYCRRADCCIEGPFQYNCPVIVNQMTVIRQHQHLWFQICLYWDCLWGSSQTVYVLSEYLEMHWNVWLQSMYNWICSGRKLQTIPVHLLYLWHSKKL